MSTIGSAIDIFGTPQMSSRTRTAATDPYIAAFQPRITIDPETISIERLPATGSDFFDRETDVAFLNDAWGNQDVNVVVIVAKTGFGKCSS